MWSRGSHFFSYISEIRHFGAVWAWPDLYGCAGAMLGAAVGVSTGVTFGVAVDVETRTAVFGSGVTVSTNCGVYCMAVVGCGTGLGNLV